MKKEIWYLLKDLKDSGYEYGYSFDMEICEMYSQMDEISLTFLFELLKDPNSKMNVFLYSEE